MTPTEAYAKARGIVREVMADAQIHKSGMARISAEALTAWLQHRLGKEFAAAVTQAHAAGLAQGRAEGREEAARWHDKQAEAYATVDAPNGQFMMRLHSTDAAAIRSLKP